MYNPFDRLSTQIREFEDAILSNEHVTEHYARFLISIAHDIDEKLDEARMCYTDAVGDERTSAIMDALEMREEVSDEDLAYVANRTLVQEDRNSREQLISELTAHIFG